MSIQFSVKTTSLAVAIACCFFACPSVIQAADNLQSQEQTPATQQDDFLKTIPWDAEYDVIVLGYGFAGGAAAIAAADEGSKVLLSEKAPMGKEGGNSKYSAQFAMWIDPVYPDEYALKYLQQMRGDNTNPSDETLLAYVRGAKKQLEYLEFLGAKNPTVAHASEYPEFEGSEAYGWTNIQMPGANGALYALIQENVGKRKDNIDIWFNAPGKQLIQDPKTGIIHGVIIDVDGQKKFVRAKNGVVLATGGYENNPDMFRNYANVQKAYAKGAHFNTGDGILMAMDVKANIVNMANLSGPDPNVLNPATGNAFGYMVADSKDSAWSGPAFTRHNVIMVGADGKRFWNETTHAKHGHIKFHNDYRPLRIPDPAYMIFDENARQASRVYGSWSEGNLREIENGIVKKANTIEELAEIIGVNVQGLQDEINRYNEFTKTGKDLDFGRPAELLKPLNKAPYYAVEVVPTYTNTLGGPEHDEIGAILDRDGKRIPHLYGAGELGSIWSHKYNGNGNVGESLVFGRIAGADAAKPKSDVTQNSVLGNKPGFSPTTSQQAYVLENGERIGVGQGIGGQVVLAVKTDGNKITSVRILKQNETEGIGSKALEVLPNEAVAKNGEVDNYTGATVSSSAFKAALADALKK